MIDDETISSKIAKTVFEEMAQSGTNPKQIVEEKGLIQISDPNIILQIIDDVIAKLKGIECGRKGTSCPDQIAIALEKIKKGEI